MNATVGNEIFFGKQLLRVSIALIFFITFGDLKNTLTCFLLYFEKFLLIFTFSVFASLENYCLQQPTDPSIPTWRKLPRIRSWLKTALKCSSDVSPFWRKLRLESKLSQLDVDHQQGVYEKAIQMLLHWRQLLHGWGLYTYEYLRSITQLEERT